MIEKIPTKRLNFKFEDLKSDIEENGVVFTAKAKKYPVLYVKNDNMCLDITKALTKTQKQAIESLVANAPESVSKKGPAPKAWSSLSQAEKIEELGKATGRNLI